MVECDLRKAMLSSWSTKCGWKLFRLLLVDKENNLALQICSGRNETKTGGSETCSIREPHGIIAIQDQLYVGAEMSGGTFAIMKVTGKDLIFRERRKTSFFLLYWCTRANKRHWKLIKEHLYGSCNSLWTYVHTPAHVRTLSRTCSPAHACATCTYIYRRMKEAVHYFVITLLICLWTVDLLMD